MEMCDSCNHPYDFTCNNEEGYEKRCYYCSPKQIQGYPQYFIYPDGRVWSSVKGEGRFLKAQMKCGYYSIPIYKNQKQKHYLVHRLIALHYIPNPGNLPIVDHINRDTSDNRIVNLRWTSTEGNQQNRGKTKNNTSGHKYITYNKGNKIWKFKKTYHKNTVQKTFKSKIDCICYKYITLLKIKSFKKL